MTGRPTIFSQDLADVILERIVDGDSMRTICLEDGMPSRTTLLRWLEARPEFAQRYAWAREAQGDEMDARILDIGLNCTAESAAADRVKLDALKWRAARLAPKRYGDKLTAEVSGPDGGAIRIEDLSNLEKARRILFMLAKAEADPSGTDDSGRTLSPPRAADVGNSWGGT